MTAIRQSEFADKHKLKPAEVKKLRDEHLKEGEDFYSVVRAIYWNPPAVEKIEAILAGGTTPATALPIVSVRVLKPARNKRYVYADLDGNRISIICNPRQRDKIIKKTINVRVESDGATKIYTHIP